MPGTRLKAMGTSNWEAYTVGTTLVGSVVGGAGIGWWLDGHFHTALFLPIFGLAGVVVGFIDLVRTTTRLAKEQEKKSSALRSDQVNEGRPAGWMGPEDGDAPGDGDEPKSGTSPAATPEGPDAPKRAFRVPPPDLPDWSKGPKRDK